MTAATQFSDDWGNEEPTRRIDRTEVGVISISEAELMRRKIAAWLLDRAVQLDSRDTFIVERLVDGIMQREPDVAFDHGETEDLMATVEGMRR